MFKIKVKYRLISNYLWVAGDNQYSIREIARPIATTYTWQEVMSVLEWIKTLPEFTNNNIESIEIKPVV